MGKVVINNCYGGFGLSYKAMRWLSEHGLEEASQRIVEMKAYLEEKIINGSIESKNFDLDIKRHHPLLIQCVEELKLEANGIGSHLEVREFKGNLYCIDEYNGLEYIETPDTLNWEDCTNYQN